MLYGTYVQLMLDCESLTSVKDNIEWESRKDSNGFRVLTSYDNFVRAQMKSDLVTLP